LVSAKNKIIRWETTVHVPNAQLRYRESIKHGFVVFYSQDIALYSPDNKGSKLNGSCLMRNEPDRNARLEGKSWEEAFSMECRALQSVLPIELLLDGS